MTINIALEWFLNPDHLPFIVGVDKGYYKESGIELNIIVPNEHYDGFNALKNGEIEMAINEPLHLIEQFDENMLSLGAFFETRGGVMLSIDGEKKLLRGECIKISSPVSNETTNKIAIEIIVRYAANLGIMINPLNIAIEEVDFYHITNIKNGYDGAWLAFYNFEGVEAELEGVDNILIDSKLGAFENFSALDIYTTKAFYGANKEIVHSFLEATKKAVTEIKRDVEYAKKAYYGYAKEEPSMLMDKIIEATAPLFDEYFVSSAQKERKILQFFKTLGITTLSYESFENAFLGS